MTRHTTTGNSRPHIVHPGYQHASRHSSRWERLEPKSWLARNWFWLALAIATVLAFDHAMTTDARANCGGGYEHEGC